MGSIYQLIFFFAIALLAITITVFVLAVSLLGRAVRLSAQEQIEAEGKRKKDTEDEIKKIQDKLGKAKAVGRVDIEDLVRSLRDLESKDAKHKWKLRWIKIKPKLLTATWGALIPGAFFLISAIFSALALNPPGGTATASLYFWLALIAMGIGICFVCLTLKVIEGVAITSEETAVVREIEVFKTALREIEVEKKPELKLAFEDVQLPFTVEAGSEMLISSTVGLTRGDIARKLGVYFLAPLGFAFLDSPKGPRAKGKYANYVSTEVQRDELISPFHWRKGIKVKVPSQPNSYTGVYRVVCEGFDSGFEEFEIVAKEVEIPFE